MKVGVAGFDVEFLANIEPTATFSLVGDHIRVHYKQVAMLFTLHQRGHHCQVSRSH